MKIVSLYAAILTLMFIVLSVRTLRLRRKLRIAIGDQGNAAMIRAIRVHSNFAEYVPLALLLLLLAENQGAPSSLLHVLGSALVMGRTSHAYGLSQVAEKFVYRVFGMAVTLSSLGIMALYLLFLT